METLDEQETRQIPILAMLSREGDYRYLSQLDRAKALYAWAIEKPSRWSMDLQMTGEGTSFYRQVKEQGGGFEKDLTPVGLMAYIGELDRETGHPAPGSIVIMKPLTFAETVAFLPLKADPSQKEQEPYREIAHEALLALCAAWVKRWEVDPELTRAQFVRDVLPCE